ncbi:hypothetical protein STRCI_002536 [Streptomyces cinnabarinus]|uniref:Tat pathway signal sequence domain protein n=1 Tax=Streptomyces cinnabarinus TaxID=67287 RepID=A0ABY7KAI6_9ACTN|nr:hypothetical protein [Streptomyces cinnabarinus]WAZ21369.1 hypothetical protein STRCI_002536 [Streptomyces cinnabarinus]
MSVDRETNGDMTHRDIALLLAEAADEVEIGIAPTQAVLRGGRRRRARRWAVAAATTLVIAGTSGAVAVAGLPGGTDKGQVATRPSSEQRDLSAPYRTTLATGTDQGEQWSVFVDVWPVPRNEAEAATVWNALVEADGTPPDAEAPADLIGTVTYFVKRSYGERTSKVMENRIPASDTMSGRDLQTAAIPLAPDTDGPQRLVIGQVAGTAQFLSCHWKDGTSTKVGRARPGEEAGTDEALIRPAQGSPVDWFVCVAPRGTSYKEVLVTLPALP